MLVAGARPSPSLWSELPVFSIAAYSVLCERIVNVLFQTSGLQQMELDSFQMSPIIEAPTQGSGGL